MEYYYIYKFIDEIIDNIFRKCIGCKKNIWRNPIYYEEQPFCSFICLTNYYEENYIKKIDK